MASLSDTVTVVHGSLWDGGQKGTLVLLGFTARAGLWQGGLRGCLVVSLGRDGGGSGMCDGGSEPQARSQPLRWGHWVHKEPLLGIPLGPCHAAVGCACGARVPGVASPLALPARGSAQGHQ